jgi:hypothetical protein
MYRFLYLIMSIVITTIACSSNRERQQELKKIVSDTNNFTSIQWLDTTFNLGTISAGEVKELKFRFINTGNKPLYLGNVNAGCGCTVPSFSKEAVGPGKEGFVMASFDSKKQCDLVTKYIYVPSNAKNDSLSTLSFTANIINCQSNEVVVPKRATLNDSLEIK